MKVFKEKLANIQKFFREAFLLKDAKGSQADLKENHSPRPSAKTEEAKGFTIYLADSSLAPKGHRANTEQAFCRK